MRTIVVTGAGSGIGAAAARAFVALGDRVFGADLIPDGVPTEATAIRVDVSDSEDVAHMIEVAIEASGRIDVLCNNAGIGSTSDPIHCTEEEWERVFAVNARGVFLCTRAVLPTMLSQSGGVIVNTASVAGMIGLRDRAAYCASKAAVIGFTKAVAIQYAGAGIRCNAVCPGTVDSPWVRRLLDYADDPHSARRELVARQPMRRLGRPDEVAAAIVYLASKDAAFMTGSELVIDGGILAGLGLKG